MIFPAALDPEIDSAPNGDEYHKYLLGVKAAGA
jgi:hypothetical protein